MFDLIIRNARIIDGTGAPERKGALAVRDDRIVAVGDLSQQEAKETIDAGGSIACPGFVDTHNHAFNEHNGGILRIPHADNLVRQGITTVLSGACGGSGYPVGEHLEAVEELSFQSNYAAMCGYNTVKARIVPKSARVPSRKEKVEILALIREAMEEGAFGVTTGVLGHAYEKTSTQEIIDACRVAARYDGLYHGHIRDEGEWGHHLEALAEVVTISREAGIRALSSHLKLWGRLAWGQTAEVDAIFENAEKEGIPARADMYGYTGGYRGLGGLVASLRNRVSADDLRRETPLPEVLEAIDEQLDLIGGADHVILCPLKPDPEINGKTLLQVARERGQDPAPTACDLMRAKDAISCCWLAMRDEDVEHFLAAPYTMICTDGHLREMNSGHCHPRNFGNYPRILGACVRERGVLGLEAAIHKMTSAPADMIGIPDRGVLRKNAFADIVVFDADTIADRTSWADPYQYPAGIAHVLVNGRFAVRDGQTTTEYPGRVIRRGE